MQIKYVFLFPAQWMNNVEEGYLQIYVTEAIFIVKCLKMLIEGVKTKPIMAQLPFLLVPTSPRLTEFFLLHFYTISIFPCHKVIIDKFPFLPIIIGRRHQKLLPFNISRYLCLDIISNLNIWPKKEVFLCHFIKYICQTIDLVTC